ncbi:restriction endonuclease subunit S [Glutamicibacter creatinolyticus]|uniref:restriction endonuclease subunit S n=1 Tax=Glutamicibacter creatinolyticus TaxID=162496 RepID=UPI0037C1075D
MSQIDELLAKHCPEGVEFRPLAEITSKSTGIKWASVADASFEYIDLSSVDRVTRRIGETVSVTAADAPSRARQIVRTGDVIFATTRPTQMRWAVIPEEYDEQIASTGYCVLRPNNDVILTNFLAHILGTGNFSRYVESNQVEGNYPSIPDSRIREFKVPVPPFEIQREIVRILDTFSKMEAELEAELEARKLQYEHYRDRLVGRRNFVSCEWTELAVAASIRTGSKPTIISDSGNFPYINAGNEPSGFTNNSNAPGGAVTIPSRGQGGAGHVGFQKEDFWCGPLCYRVETKSSAFINKFLYYYLRNIQEELVGLRKVGSIPAVNKSDLGKVKVPMPDIEDQRRIVDLLDKFDVLVNDLSLGLPAELAARRQQYEYYRDQLLTFKEAG